MTADGVLVDRAQTLLDVGEDIGAISMDRIGGRPVKRVIIRCNEAEECQIGSLPLGGIGHI